MRTEADIRAEADIIIESVSGASWAGRRGMRQARIAQRGYATLARARNALAELAHPSGIAGAQHLAASDARECADALDFDTAVLETVATDERTDDSSRTMAINTASNLRDMVVTLRQASAVSMV